jgi:hypothetical protein
VVSIWCVGGWEYAEEEEEEKKIEGKKKRWSGWIFLPGKAAHMECSQPATLCCYCCCFSFFGVVAMSGFFFPFLSFSRWIQDGLLVSRHRRVL